MTTIHAAAQAADPTVACPECGGTGRVANDDTDSLTTPMWSDCRTCDSTGQAPEPDEHEESRPVDLDACTNCEGRGETIVIADGDTTYRTCSWCLGSGNAGPGRGWVQ